MRPSTPKALRAEKARVEAQIKRRGQLEQIRARKDDTRRKVLVGAVVLGWIASDLKLALRLYRHLDASLTRVVDRRVFGTALQRVGEPMEGTNHARPL